MDDARVRIDQLRQRIQNDADDVEAHKELGIVYMRAREYAQARPFLHRAYELDADDAETRFYFALALETTGSDREALAIYGTYTQLSRLSSYRRLMAGRYTWLARHIVRSELRARMAAEEQDFVARDPALTAVFPLNYQGDDERYGPLGRGLAEMLMVDLAQVDALDVVERVRLQALLDELELAESGRVDAETAPRLGRLLGAGRVVGGTYDILEGDVLRLDLSSWKSGEAIASDYVSRTGALEELFALQKDVVFQLLDRYAINLTLAERQAIEQVPTRDLQAFLAYSRGLLAEDAGNYDAAQQHFVRAQELDPNFEEAQQAAETATGAGTADEVLSAAGGGERPSDAQTNDLVEMRQQRLGETVEAVVIPGQDDREPAAETAGAARQLPGAPRPPARDR